MTGVLSGLSDANAAREAGYGKWYASKASMWIRSSPKVKQAIEKEQSALRQQAKYDVEQAVAEIDKAVVFGYARKNPMSVAKLLELKAKLYGLLIDRYQEVPVDMRGALEEARHRTFGPINITPKPSALTDARGTGTDTASNGQHGNGQPFGD